ncbi:MAG: M28 family peptidase [Thermoproteota archaeon]|nr:M28 family peptidase [Thermoproteota archaeon]
MKRFATISIIISLLLFFVILAFSSQDYAYSFDLPMKFSFNSHEAYLLGKKFAKDFPYKYSGSEDLKNAAKWLEENLKSWNYTVVRQEFKVRLGNEVNLINIIALKKGKSDKQILILTNIDQAPTAYESAYTSAAVGTILSLAHTLANETLNKTLVFAFVDGEEWGMIGAAYLAQNYPFGKLPEVALVPEYVDVGKAVAIAVDPIGQFSGYSPLWLRELIKACTKSINLEFYQPFGFEEYARRAVLISFTDQGPLLRYGIQAVQYSTVGDNPELGRQVYHTTQDVYELVNEQAIDAYGKVTECAFRAIDNMNDFPHESSYYLLINDSKVVKFPSLTLAQIILFFPLFFVSVYFERLKIDKKAIILFILIFLSFLLSYAFAKIFPFINIMPYYELYPPPPRHPLLYQPNYLAMGLWFVITIALLYAFYFVYLRFKIEKDKMITTAHVLLSIISIIYLIYNPFGATLLLLPAAYLWLFISPKKSHRIFNLLLIIFAGIMIYLLIYVYSQRIYLDLWSMLWYLFMGVVYNLFTLPSLLIYMSTLSVAIMLTYLSIKR